MKKIKIIYKALLVLILISACKDENNLDFLNDIPLPTNVGANFGITQDNSGLVTITPYAEGATSFDILYGDGTTEAANVPQGQSTENTYAEGSYQVKVTAYNVKGESTEITQDLVVSFKAPENLSVTIENDAAVSKQVNITTTADFATTYEFHSGETGVDQPVTTANIGETINYQYTTAGTYTVKVIAKGGAIETTEYTEDFEVTEILAPLTKAPSPPSRNSTDVISMYSEAYLQTTVDSYTTDWSNVTLQEEVTIESNKTLVYRELAFAGIITESSPINVAAMEFVHIDVWSSDVNDFKLKFVDFNGTGYNGGVDNIEYEVTKTLDTQGAWISYNIPLSEFIDVPFTDINQIVVSADPVGTVFIDNFYFYRAPTTTPGGGVTPITFETEYTLDQFDGGGTQVIANPDTNENTSANVLELVKGSGQPWAGSKITVPTPFSFASSTTVTMKVWSPRVGLNLLAKFENEVPWPDVTATADVVATTTVANAWEELTFDFSGIDESITWYNLVLIMDNGTQGDGTANYTIYLDDISTNPVLDFEPGFSLDQFDGGGTQVIANPDTNGNTSANVLELVKGSGQPWAGSKITVPTPFTFSGTTLKMKVWSPRTGLNLLAKFENDVPWPDVTATAEITETTTLANGWQELSFDFTGIDMSIDWYNLVLIMDNGTQGDGTANYTIYVDDITIE